MAAPKKKPAKLKLVEGRGDGRDSGGRMVPKVPGFVRLPPEPPEFLEGEARDEWERVLPELQRLQLTKTIEAASLAAYCLAWQRFSDAQRIINDEGLLHENSQGRVRHPAVAIVEAASKELRAWANEFGLTPAAESNVACQEDDGGESNPFAGSG